ncbi:NifB/NifX family molybdenum-iron cluster-binding protein [Chloroflexota bacterium]
MKIAAITEDETTISQHFGRAPLYVVVTVEEGKIVNKETRDKTGHHTFAAHQHPETAPGEPHGYDAGAQTRHASMAETISDCQVLLAGGMGWGAYESMQSYNIEPVVTDVENIDKAIKLYLEGKLPNLMERLH